MDKACYTATDDAKPVERDHKAPPKLFAHKSSHPEVFYPPYTEQAPNGYQSHYSHTYPNQSPGVYQASPALLYEKDVNADGANGRADTSSQMSPVCVLWRRAFIKFILISVILILLIGAVVGGAVGDTLGKKHTSVRSNPWRFVVILVLMGMEKV
jgi:hypothetical protein